MFKNLRNLFKQTVRDAIYEMWPEISKLLKSDVYALLLQNVTGLFTFEQNSQYLVVVRDDETAQELVAAFNQRFSPNTRIIVLAAEDVRVLQITGTKRR